MPWVSTCGICGKRVEGGPARPGDVEGVYDRDGVRHPHCERDAQLVALRAASPKRANAGRVIALQDDMSDTPLFSAMDQGRLL